MRKAIDDVIRHDLVAMTSGVPIDGGVHVKLKPILEKVQAVLWISWPTVKAWI